MVSIPADCFLMGDGAGVGYDNERPVHNVCVSPFQMDILEVTVANYQRCVEVGFPDGFCERPGDYDSATGRSDYYPTWSNYPVIFVSWSQAEKYCISAGKRLPTEAEWEYAARGGLDGKIYSWGNETPFGRATSSKLTFSNGKALTPVGSYAANGYGLYDMTGNACEWVNDWYSETYYRESPREKPPGPPSGKSRVLRGVEWSWNPNSDNLRVAGRSSNSPANQTFNAGFRCAVD